VCEVQERGIRPPLTATRRLGVLVAVAAAVIGLDQLTKWWAVNTLDDHDIHVVWTLRFHLTQNSGAAFSRAAGRGSIVGLIAIGVVIALVWLGRGIDSRSGAVALGLVLGGALGNLADRAFRHGPGLLGGSVIDFVDVQWWPIFNVADAAITVGAVLLVLVLNRKPAP
jgi:signal peptidase II